jgi:hypothetical protein
VNNLPRGAWRLREVTYSERLDGCGCEVKRASRKKLQVHESEANWGGFLVDADAVASLPFLDRATKAAAHDDRDIVKEAWDQRRTIVTSNRRDFLR